MDGCVQLGAVLPPLFILGEDSDAALDRSRRAGPEGAERCCSRGEDSAQKEGGGEPQAARMLRLRPLHFSLKASVFCETPYPLTHFLSLPPPHPTYSLIPASLGFDRDPNNKFSFPTDTLVFHMPEPRRHPPPPRRSFPTRGHHPPGVYGDIAVPPGHWRYKRLSKVACMRHTWRKVLYFFVAVSGTFFNLCSFLLVIFLFL